MNINVRRRRDAFIGMKAYRQENPDDFPAPSVEATQMDRVEMALSVIESASASQVGKMGDSRYGYNLKGVARENLREEMSGMRDISDSMSYEFPGIDLLFHIPKHLSDGALLALGKAFHERAAPKEDDFTRYRLKSTFLTDLQKAIDAFEASLTPPEAARGEQVEATATVGEAVRDGMIGRRILMGVMKAKYKSNPAKWRAWLAASHIEKDSPKDDKGDGGNNQPKDK